MAQLLNNSIVLKADETEGEPFNLHAGDHAIKTGKRGAASIPATITLQYRFKDETGRFTDWQTDSTLASSDPSGIFQADPISEYRVTVSAAGASVMVTPVKMATN